MAGHGGAGQWPLVWGQGNGALTGSTNNGFDCLFPFHKAIPSLELNIVLQKKTDPCSPCH